MREEQLLKIEGSIWVKASARKLIPQINNKLKPKIINWSLQKDRQKQMTTSVTL
jgi:hypothetical protein